MQHELTIERLSYGASAIAHMPEGKVVFVDHACPGDTGLIQITHEGSRFNKGRLTQLTQPSDMRIGSSFHEADGTLLPPVLGAPWAHIKRSAQLQAKRGHVVDALTRMAHIDARDAEALVSPCIHTQDAWGYRNKIELDVVNSSQGKLTLGMREHDGQFTPTPNNPLIHDECSDLTEALQGALRYAQGSTLDLGIDRIGIRHSTRTKQLQIALWGRPQAFPRNEVAKILKQATGAHSIVRILRKDQHARKARRIVGVEVLHGNERWKERLAGFPMKISAPSFFQVNTEVAESMVAHVMNLIDELLPSHSPGNSTDSGAYTPRIADLYCGAGTFTLPCIRAGYRVSGVEMAGSSVKDLRAMMKQHELSADIVAGDACKAFDALASTVDLVIVDPPRSGITPQLSAALRTSHAEHIILVSCDPITLARDINRICEDKTWRLASVTPFDMFPQTYHVETVCLMTRV